VSIAANQAMKSNGLVLSAIDLY